MSSKVTFAIKKDDSHKFGFETQLTLFEELEENLKGAIHNYVMQLALRVLPLNFTRSNGECKLLKYLLGKVGGSKNCRWSNMYYTNSPKANRNILSQIIKRHLRRGRWISLLFSQCTTGFFECIFQLHCCFFWCR